MAAREAEDEAESRSIAVREVEVQLSDTLAERDEFSLRLVEAMADAEMKAVETAAVHGREMAEQAAVHQAIVHQLYERLMDGEAARTEAAHGVALTVAKAEAWEREVLETAEAAVESARQEAAAAMEEAEAAEAAATAERAQATAQMQEAATAMKEARLEAEATNLRMHHLESKMHELEKEVEAAREQAAGAMKGKHKAEEELRAALAEVARAAEEAEAANTAAATAEAAVAVAEEAHGLVLADVACAAEHLSSAEIASRELSLELQASQQALREAGEQQAQLKGDLSAATGRENALQARVRELEVAAAAAASSTVAQLLAASKQATFFMAEADEAQGALAAARADVAVANKQAAAACATAAAACLCHDEAVAARREAEALADEHAAQAEAAKADTAEAVEAAVEAMAAEEFLLRHLGTSLSVPSAVAADECDGPMTCGARLAEPQSALVEVWGDGSDVSDGSDELTPYAPTFEHGACLGAPSDTTLMALTARVVATELAVTSTAKTTDACADLEGAEKPAAASRIRSVADRLPPLLYFVASAAGIFAASVSGR